MWHKKITTWSETGILPCMETLWCFIRKLVLIFSDWVSVETPHISFICVFILISLLLQSKIEIYTSTLYSVPGAWYVLQYCCYLYFNDKGFICIISKKPLFFFFSCFFNTKIPACDQKQISVTLHCWLETNICSKSLGPKAPLIGILHKVLTFYEPHNRFINQETSNIKLSDKVPFKEPREALHKKRPAS